MVHYRGWAGGKGKKLVRGRLNPPLGVFGIAMSSRSASHGPKHA